MAKKKEKENTELPKIIVNAIEELKGEDIICLDLRKLKNAISDFFIICSGNSNTQVDAIANFIYDDVSKKLKIKPWHSEGFQNAEWILLDYVDTVVHIFQKETREFYNLENLWADAEIITFNELKKKKIVRKKTA
jgi:ribosome-associated protein